MQHKNKLYKTLKHAILEIYSVTIAKFLLTGEHSSKKLLL